MVYIDNINSKSAAGKTKYKAYPESLTVSCSFPYNVEYNTSYSKTQTVSNSYSLGISASKDGPAFSASMDVKKDALIIKNRSSSSDNLFKIFYDFQPGFTGYSNVFEDYLYNTTEHIAAASVSSMNTDYQFTISFTTNKAYTKGLFVYNTSDACTKLTDKRTIRVDF